MEIRFEKSSTVDVNDLFRELVSLEDLTLTRLNVPELKLGYLHKLKSISIENPNLASISVDTFQSNRELTILNIVGLENPSRIVEQFSHWPAGISSSIGSLKMENCNLKSFPQLSSNFAKNLTHLSLASNPIERINVNDTIFLSELQNLVLSGTKLDNLEMGGLKIFHKLKALDLSATITMKDLPKEIQNMDVLESINFDMTELSKLSIMLPASIRKLSALKLTKPIRISLDFLSRCRRLHLLTLNSLDTGDIKFLVDNAKVFQESLRVLSLDGSVVWKPELWTMIKDLKNLEILYWNKANIDSIPDEVLNNLTNLKTLSLSGNALSYDSINTAGFQSISRHLTTLDLSFNQLISLPPCMFYLLRSLDRINVLNNGIECDCNILWLLERIRSSPAVYPMMNFTCASGRNAGKRLYELRQNDLVNCSTKISPCLPLKTGFYEIPFNLVYVPGDLKFRIDNINGSYLRFIFDYMKVNVKQENESYHSDIKKYDLNSTWIVMTHAMPPTLFTVCLTLVRHMEEYEYEYNCRSINGPVINKDGWVILIGAFVGMAVVLVIIIVVVVVLLRRRSSTMRKKKSMQAGRDEDIYSVCSSEYSEPDDTYQVNFGFEY